jgi:hypothetical protein
MSDFLAGEVYHFDSTGENLLKFIPFDSNLPLTSLVSQDLKDLGHRKVTPNPCPHVSRTK